MTIHRRSLAVWMTLWLTLLGYSFVVVPIPGVNEPHYLGKAKHFWNPAWCPGDLLLESSNAHWVFYVAVGFWSQWLTLPMLAFAGRLVGYGLLARGWQRMHAVLGLDGWPAWRSLLAFLALESWGNFSGEWLVGGIEGKVFAYACLMFAFAEWQARRIYRVALWSGAAISFHPVVGLWAVLAGALAEAMTLLIGHFVREPEALARMPEASFLASASGFLDDHSESVIHRPPLPRGGEGTKPWMRALVAFVLLAIAAAPGMIPALELVFTNDPPHVRINGTYLQVYYRLAHHLDPMEFPARSYVCYAGLCLLAVGLHRLLSRVAAGRMWLLIVFWSAIFAAVGVVIGFGPRPAAQMPFYLERMKLLKFYPFRLFDVLIPITVAMQLTLNVDRMVGRTLRAVWIAALLAILSGGVWRQNELRQPTAFDTPAWFDVCRWAREHTPSDALIQTPVRNPNFKWHAQRAEYVTYKDVPQDNRGLIEWNRRLNFLRKWYQDHNAGGYSVEELQSLHAETGIDVIVTDRLGPFDVPPCYTNDVFRVYDLTQLPE